MNSTLKLSVAVLTNLLAFSMGQDGAINTNSKAMVVGGKSKQPPNYHSGNTGRVEVLNLEGSGANCQDRIPDYPLEVRFAVGAYLPDLNMPVVCGGEIEGIDDETTNLCFAYDKKITNWTEFASMSQRRQEHASSVLPDGTMFITGGVDQNFDDLDTTEMYSPTQGQFLPGPTLPHTMRGHCQVTVGVNTVFVGGGETGGSDDWDNAFLLDIASGEHVKLANMPGEVEYPTCGLATRSNGAVDIVVQREYTTYLLDVATRQWRVASHPDIDNELYAASLQQGKETVYIIGGYTGDYLDTVFRYLPDEEAWEEMELTTTIVRRSSVAIPVPDELVDC